jgi:drug/metabolite transporter (DMT)-like permease
MLLLFALAPLFGPLTRDLAPIHWAGLTFQVLAVASFGYLFWFMLLKIYPASGVASFSFLSPVCGVALGWLVLGEEIGPEIIGGLCLVAVGLVLINRKPRIPR